MTLPVIGAVYNNGTREVVVTRYAPANFILLNDDGTYEDAIELEEVVEAGITSTKQMVVCMDCFQTFTEGSIEGGAAGEEEEIPVADAEDAGDARTAKERKADDKAKAEQLPADEPRKRRDY